MTREAGSSAPQLLSPRVLALVVGAVTFLVAVLAVLVFAAPDATRWLSWQSTQGAVGSISETEDRGHLVYGFEAGDRLYEGEHDVPPDTGLRAGSPVTVRFDPADPSNSVPGPAFEEELAFLIGMVVLAAAVAGLAAYLTHRHMCRARAGPGVCQGLPPGGGGGYWQSG